MERWKGKVALVSGASVGIGFEIAKELAKAGMKVVGFSRNPEKLKVCWSKSREGVVTEVCFVVDSRALAVLWH